MKEKIKRLLKRIEDFFFPPTCAVCQKALGSEGLCADCFNKIRFIVPPYCPICGRPLDFSAPWDMTCPACLKKKPPYKKMRSICVYDDGIKPLLLGFKHGRRFDYAPLLIRLMKQADPSLFTENDIFTSVPLHWTRLMKRGYNQSAVLATALAKAYHKTYEPGILKRRRPTRSQGHLSPDQRRQNVAGAFCVPKPALVKDKDILLIDDVITTGATVGGCVRALIRAGAKSVSVLSIARVVK